MVGDDIAAEENVGRGIFSKGQAKRAHRGRILINVFLEREGIAKLSVDRLDIVPYEKAIEIADKVAFSRNGTFYGWAVISTKTAALNDRRVIASPQLDNPYHADIVLPDQAVEDRDEQKRHAQELADASSWRDRNDYG